MLGAVLGGLTGCTHLVWYGRSPDRRHVAAVIETGSTQHVRHDMTDGPPYAGIGVDQLRLDGAHCAYPARLDDGGWVVVLDGTPGPRFDGIGEVALVGGQLVYAAERSGRWFLARAAGEPLGPYDEVLSGSLTPDASGAWAAVIRRDEQTFVVADGAEHGPFETAGQLSFVGGQAQFVARTSAGAYVYAGGGREGPWDDVAELAAGLARPVYAVRNAQGFQVWDGRSAGPRFDRIFRLTVASSEPLYAGRADGAEWVVHGERRYGPFTALKAWLGVSAAGCVFAGQRDSKWWVTRGGEQLGPFDDVTSLATASGHDAFIALRQGLFVVVRDGLQHATWELATSLVFSPDGRRLMYVAREGKQLLLVVDGQKRPFDLVLPDTLAFSRDGRHHAAVIGEATTKRLFITFDDGTRTPVDMEELTAAVSRQSLTGLSTPAGAVLPKWVEAELRWRYDAKEEP